MYEIGNEVLELRFNKQKIKNLESALGISLMSEISTRRGMLSLSTLEGMFAVGLYNVTTEQNVVGKKASEYFDKLIEDIGYVDLTSTAVVKLQKDMGFLFQSN